MIVIPTHKIEPLANQNWKFREMATSIRDLLQSDLCIAWRFDKKEGRFGVEAWDGELDETYRKTVFLNPEQITYQYRTIQKAEPIYILDVKNEEIAPDYFYREEAKKRGWTTLICIPLVHNKRIIGFVDSYTYKPFQLLSTELERVIMSSLRAFATQAAESIINIELSNRLQTLQDINQLLTGIFDEQDILNQILVKSLELVGADFGHIYLKDINRKELILKAWRGISDKHLEHTRKLGQGLTGYVAITGIPENIPDVTKEPRHIPIPGVPINSKVAIPLHREEQIIGVLSVKSRFYEGFTNDDMNLLTALATQATIAIERARLNKHLQEISRLALGEDYMALLNYVVNAVHDLTFADVTLWMIGGREEGRGKYLRIVASAGNIGKDYLKDVRLPIDSNISINVLTLKEKRPIIRPNIQNDSEEPEFYQIERAYERDWHGFMAVPLIQQKGKPLGVLSLYSKEIAKFGPPEVQLMQTFANQVAIALEQQQKNHELKVSAEIQKRQASELEALRKTTLKIVAQEEDVKSLLEALVEEATHLLKAKGGKVYLRVQNEDKIELVAEKNVDTTLLPLNSRLSFGDGVAGEVFVSKRPLIIKDYASSKWCVKELAHLFTGIIEVPLLLNGEAIGVICVFDDVEKRTFSEQDIPILERFAQQASLAIHNAKLFEKSQNRLQVLDALQQTSLDIVQNLEFDKLMPEIIDRASKLIASQAYRGIGAAYVRCDYGKKVAIIEYSKNQGFKNIELNLDRGIVGKVLRTGKAQYINSYPHSADYSPIFDEKNLNPFLENVICVPIKQDHKIEALIVISEAYGERLFSNDDVELLSRFADLAAIAIQNAQRIRDIEIINEIVEILSTQLNSDKLLEIMISLITKQLDCTRCIFFSPSAESHQIVLEPKVIRGNYIEESKGQTFRAGEGITGWVFEHGESVLLTQASKDSRFVGAKQGEYEPSSLLVVPVKEGKKTIGVISADQDMEHNFDEYDQRFLETLARHAGIAIERVNLFQKIQQQKETQTHAIHEIAQSIPTEKPLGQILERLLEWTLSLMGEASLGEIRLLDDKTNELVVQAARGESHQEFRRLRIGKGVTGWVAEHKTYKLIADVRKEDNYVQFLDATRSELAVPMLRGDNLIGVLNIEHPELDAFTQEDLKLAEAIAGLAVVAIENNRLFEELDDRATRLERLQKVTTTISIEPSDLDNVLLLIIDSLSEIFNGSPCVIRLYDAKKDIFSNRVAQKSAASEEQAGKKPRFNGISRYVIKTKAPYYVENSDDILATEKPIIPKIIANQGIRAIAALPLKSENEIIGVLYLNLKESHQFTQNDKQILELFANQAAVAIKNAQLYKQIQLKSNSEIKIIREIAQSIAIDSLIDQNEVLGKIVNSMVSLMGNSTLFNVRLLNKETNELELVAYEGNIDEARFPFRLEIGEGITGWVAQHKKPLIVSDVREDSRYLPGLVGGRSELAVPLLKGDKLIGVLNLEGPEINAFTENDLQLSEAIAGLTVVALENARHMREFKQQIRELKEFDQRKSEFLSTVSHELRTPLAPIQSFLEGLLIGRYDIKTPKGQDRLKRALKNVNHETRLVSNLLDLVRIQNGRIQLDLVYEDAIEIIYDIIQQFEDSINQKEVLFKLDLPKENHLVTHLDRDKFRQIISNLIDNAIKFTPCCNHITLSVRNKNNWIKIKVSDTGIGIPKSEQEKIFDRFYQVDNSLTREVKGSGIGLHITKQYVELHGGQIWVESQLDKGTTFTFTLPQNGVTRNND